MLLWISGSSPGGGVGEGSPQEVGSQLPRKVGHCRAGQGPSPSPAGLGGDGEGCCPLTPRQPGSQARALAWEPETLGPGSSFAMWP